MNKIERIKFHLGRTDNIYLFQDTRAEARQFAEVINKLIKKQNEVIAAVNSIIEEMGKT
jgi:hypothetical protein